ncbi:FtsX-like permease family protein [Catellatospora sp. NPDC049609]|uniref:FtsX-like permease family protein n=1 Tax=Catellatospora sp. NPDC049609 TaxID=3155505 RepID=UPI00341BEFB1
MTALLWAMVRARRGLALITLVLTAAAAAAAAAGPLYQQAATTSLYGVELAAATVGERVYSAQNGERLQSNVHPSLPYVPGFQTVDGLAIQGSATGERDSADMFLASRTGVCEHLVIVRGRCATAEHEVVLREDAGATIGAQPGRDLTFTLPAATGPDEGGGPLRLTVVGFYQRLSGDDPYWAGRPPLVDPHTPAAFVTERTVVKSDRNLIRMIDLIAGPDAFGDMEQLRAELEDAEAELEAGGYGTDSELPDLLTRLDDGAAQLSTSLLLAAVPLVLLCWLVLFIAVAGGVEQRRGELGLTALRGVPGRTRWWLATAETALPVLIAIVPGYLLGYAVTAVLAATVLPGSPAVVPNVTSIVYTAIAVLGALAAGMLAQVRALTVPVLALLRRARVRKRRGLVGGVEAMVGALALVAGYQVAAGGDTGSGGLALLAPLCIGLGLGLVAARLVGVPAERLGRRALRRGRLRTGLAALTLARGGGTHWIVVLLTVVFGLLGFALSAGDAAGRAWQERADVQTGAARVLSVQSLPPSSLLHAVRTTDPQGRYAMATMRVNINNEVPLLAVDSSRLPAVALWPQAYGALSAEEAARLLRPSPVTPLALRAAEVDITVTLDRIASDASAGLTLRLVATDGRQSQVRVERLREGTHTYRVKTTACADSPCRFKQLSVDHFTRGRYMFDMTIGDLRDPSGNVLIGAADLARHHWRLPETSAARPVPEVVPAPAGLRLRVDTVLTPDLRAFADSAPNPLPLVAAGTLPGELLGYGGTVRLPVARAGTMTLAPRNGAQGALVDMEYADMRLGQDGDALEAEVWLAPDAPADIVARLEANGLTVLSERTADGLWELYGEQAPALALWFLAAAAFTGVAFAAGGLLVTAVLERGHPDEGLAVLRAQGVSRRTLRGAALGGRFALVLAGSAIGLLSAAASWALARGVVPVFADGGYAPAASKLPGVAKQLVVPPPELPSPLIAVPIAVAVLVLLTTCLLATRVAGGASKGATS